MQGGLHADDGAALAEYAVREGEAKGLDYCDAYFERVTGRSYALEHGSLNGSSYSENAGLRMRMVKDGVLFMFTTNRLDNGTVKDAISSFRKFRSAGAAFSAERANKASWKVKAKEEVDGKRMLDDMMGVDKALKGRKEVIFRSVYGYAETVRTFFASSEGSRISAEVPRTGSFASMIVKDRGETRQRVLQKGSVGGYETFRADLLEKEALEEVDSLLRVIRKGVTLKADEMRKARNIVIAPEITGIAVHESVGHPNEADRVFGREAAQAGTSYVTGEREGLRIGSAAVDIFDDPTLTGTNGFYLYDDEGTKARKRHIVKSGMQNELLTNRQYARILGERSNGSARSSSYSDEPLIRMANSYMGKGRAEKGELFREAKEGVYIKSFMEWNIDDTRSFSRYQGNEAYLIRGGEVDRPVKNFSLETRTLDFWRAVALLGKDFELFVGSCGKGEPMQGVPVTMGGPTVLLKFGGEVG